MDREANPDETWITSNDLVSITAISRATLNNYIKYGIVIKPIVKIPKDTKKGTKIIGYFPRDVIDRIELIKRMKKEGNSMENIVAMLSRTTPANIPIGQNHLSKTEGLNLSINDIHLPAYLVNNKFEIEWINSEAEKDIFQHDVSLIRAAEERNIFRILSKHELLTDDLSKSDLVTYFMRFFKAKFGKNELSNLFTGISEKEISLLARIYDQVDMPYHDPLQEAYIHLDLPEGRSVSYNVYQVTFREGILFIHAPVNDLIKDVTEILSRRGKLITDLMKQRMPSLVSFCVLVADLQDSSRICAELPPEEYFELIRDIWKSMDQIFPKYYGTYGKHVGDGMVYYFLREKDNNYVLNSIYCALELKEKMKELSMKWKIRKGWFNDLYLNIGINEGEEFFGTIPSSPYFEFTALGDSVNYAGRLSDLARYGSICTTKNLLNRLGGDERKRLHYGIRRAEQGREIFIENMFSRVMDMFSTDDVKYSKFMDIATLAVTEIISVKPLSIPSTNSSFPVPSEKS